MLPGAGAVSAGGRTGRTYGVLETRAYVVASDTRPRWPLLPPPNVVGTDAALALTYFFNVWRSAKVGFPVIFRRDG